MREKNKKKLSLLSVVLTSIVYKKNYLILETLSSSFV